MVPTLRDVAEIAWSHDGTSIVVLSQTAKIGFHYVRSFIDVCSTTGPRHVATIENAEGIGWINGGEDLGFPEHDFVSADAGPCLDSRGCWWNSHGPHAKA